MSDDDKKLEELFNAGVHLGHKSNRIHPQSRKYIYKIESGVSIIDLTKTLTNLNKAKEFVTKLAQENKILLVVVTKKIVAKAVKEQCMAKNIPFITHKWPAGLLTNFETIVKNIKTLKKMREDKENGGWEKFVKHEKQKLQKKLNRLEIQYNGLISLEKLPDALFVVDIKKEKNAIAEAKKTNITTIAVVDTNSDPNLVNYPIVGNDDSVSSIQYLVNEVINAYNRQPKQQNDTNTANNHANDANNAN